MPDRLNNRWWRINNLYMIQNKQGQKVKFKANWAQKLLYFGLWYCSLILKARQLGITTFICILYLDACLFNSNTHAGIIAHNREDAEEFFNNKVKFAYDNLPPNIKATRRATTDTARQLRFENGSSIRVGTSMRSGTLQYLHISEFGKICAKYPDKAQEIVTGALNTVQAGQFICIESTAEGQHGYFFDYCHKAQNMEREGRKLTELDFKFFFFPWWKHPEYVMDLAGVVIPQEDREYFERLKEEHGIELSDEQRAWYVKKKETQGEDMMREYPSTPEEAFHASIKGAYYAKQMAKIREQRRICRVPYEPGIKVNTGWDLGMDDQTVIWFHQRVGLENRFIDYYEINGEGLHHFAKVLQEKGYVYGDHYLPHDVSVKELGTGKTRIETLEKLGLTNIVVVSRELDLSEEDGIEAVRNLLASSWFDEARCAQGIAALDAYRKEWDEKVGGFRARPVHDWSSHPADALRTFAMGYSPRAVVQGKRNNRRRDARVV